MVVEVDKVRKDGIMMFVIGVGYGINDREFYFIVMDFDS